MLPSGEIDETRQIQDHIKIFDLSFPNFGSNKVSFIRHSRIYMVQEILTVKNVRFTYGIPGIYR